MYNLRYHLASLVAVFIALALGLLLGSVVAERGYLDEQRAALIEGIQADFEDLRDTNQMLEGEYERDHGFAVQMADAYTEGALAGRRILVLGSAGPSDGLAAANTAVVGAGGEVVTALFEEARLGLDDPEVAEAVTGLAPAPVSQDDTLAPVIEALSLEFRSPGAGSTPILDALVAQDALELEGWDGLVGVDGVVVVGAFDGVADMELVRIASRLEDLGASALGAEVSSLDEGIVSAAVEAGLSAVDHAELPQGALSIVMILAGDTDGHYGLRRGASGVNPPLGSDAP